MATRVRTAPISGGTALNTPAPGRRNTSPGSKRRFATGIALTLSLLPAVGAVPAAAQAQATCEFERGFARLRELVGADVVGTCLEDQRTVFNGNAVQQTANGPIVWRLADNWTVFTDGYYTWINGPDGLERRLNTELFPWESTPA